MITVASLGILILAALSVFQGLLIAGKPLGNYAWGGQHKTLPKRLRAASGISIVLYVVFAIFLASKAGVANIIPGGTFLDVAIWVLAGYFVLGILMNAVSRSKQERIVMTPVAAALAVVYLLVALN